MCPVAASPLKLRLSAALIACFFAAAALCQGSSELLGGAIPVKPSWALTRQLQGHTVRPQSVFDLNCPGGPPAALIPLKQPFTCRLEGNRLLDGSLEGRGFVIVPAFSDPQVGGVLWLVEEMRLEGRERAWFLRLRIPLGEAFSAITAATLVEESPVSGPLGVLLFTFEDRAPCIVPRDGEGRFLFDSPIPVLWNLDPQRVLSLSCDPISGEILIAYSTIEAGREVVRIVVANLVPDSVLPLPRLEVVKSFAPPVGVASPGFAAWCDRGGQRGIVVPVGLASHEGLLWIPCPGPIFRGVELPPGGLLFGRLAGVSDRFLCRAAVGRRSLYVIGAQTGRVYEFDPGEFKPSSRLPDSLSFAPVLGQQASRFITWIWGESGFASVVPWEVAVFHGEEPVLPEPVPASEGKIKIEGLLPGSRLDFVVQSRSVDGRRILVSSPSASLRIPAEKSWSVLHFAKPFRVTGIDVSLQDLTLLCSDQKGGLFSFPLDEATACAEAGTWDEPCVSELDNEPALRPSGFEPARGFVTAFCVGGGGDLYLFNLKLNKSEVSVYTKRSGAVSYLVAPADNPRYFGDAAFDRQDNVIVLADRAAGRLLVLDPATADLKDFEVFLPGAGAFPGRPGVLPGSGPLGVAVDENRLFLLLRDPGHGEVILWQLEKGRSPALPVPVEVVPVEEDWTVAGLCVFSLGQARYAMVACNTNLGSVVLVRKLPRLNGEALWWEELDLEPGEAYIGGPFGCPGLDGVRYAVTLSREDQSSSSAPVLVDVRVEHQGRRAEWLPSISLHPGGVAVRTFTTHGQVRVTFVAKRSNEESCRLRAVVTALGEGTGCFYGTSPFVRGDVNGSGHVEIGDAITLLGYLFGGQDADSCADAADANDDGKHTVADPIALLQYLFGGGPPLPPPFPGCGQDPTPDPFPACKTYSACR